MHSDTRRNRRDAGKLMRASEAGVSKERKKAAVVRSAFMKSEEIEREREMSGWNPYAGEEEEIGGKYGNEPGRMEEPHLSRDEQADNAQQDNVQQVQPYFMMPDYTHILEEQQEQERDLRKLQSMYPDAAKQMLSYIEEECDKMEYEGSAMFDEYPDQTTVYQIGERIYDQVKDQFPMEEQETSEDVLSMQYQGPNRNRPGQNWAKDLIRVLLLQEMHHRRCRHRGCRRGRG